MYRLDNLTLDAVIALARLLTEQREKVYIPPCLNDVISKLEDEMDKAGVQLKRRIG